MSDRRPVAVTLDSGTSLANRTGNWRVRRPVFVTRTAPCNHACPAGEDVQGWLYRAEEGDYEAAWRTLVARNPLPAVMGRICFRPCEEHCNRGRLDEAVGINAVERFLGDEAIRRGWNLPAAGPDTGRRVLVVGAGPCGLAAAYHLRRLGHSVTLVDGDRRPGGMMQAGIPEYRLPRAVLAAEAERILALGVEWHPGERVTDVAAEMGRGHFDAALVAVGAQIGHRTAIPAGDSARLVDALTLLRAAADHAPPEVGRVVAVYGGGDTALDAARTARRLGATDTVVIYRRDRHRMPAHAAEVEEAEAEGVRFRWLSTVQRAEGGRLLLERTRLGPDGLPEPTGEVEEMPADALVLALGQDCDLSLLRPVPGVTVADGLVAVGPDLMTGHPGVFAGGDSVAGDRSATRAIGDGAAAAQRIDDWLAGRPWSPPPGEAPIPLEDLNTWYYSDAPRTVRPQLEAARRVTGFEEVVGGLDAGNALYEARRCMSCGHCLECDNCYGVCPDNAVLKLGDGDRYRIDYDYCKGCGICVAECPCGAIAMEPEEI